MIESFFSKMTKQMLRGIRVKSKEELAKRIYLYFDEINQEPVVYYGKNVPLFRRNGYRKSGAMIP